MSLKKPRAHIWCDHIIPPNLYVYSNGKKGKGLSSMLQRRFTTVALFPGVQRGCVHGDTDIYLSFSMRHDWCEREQWRVSFPNNLTDKASLNSVENQDVNWTIMGEGRGVLFIAPICNHASLFSPEENSTCQHGF